MAEDRKAARAITAQLLPHTTSVHNVDLIAAGLIAAREAGREAGRREERERHKWQPIETAPKDGTWILAFGDGLDFASCSTVAYYGLRSGYEEAACWRRTGWRAEPISPTHWMPLPEPPDA